MIDVFISYSSKDRDKARAMAKVLEARGLTVWWDRSILPGESFDDAIERAIADARCLVVLWSNHSVQSRWVRNEASEGDRRGVLVPALLEEAPIPLQFRSMQAADLRNWDIVSPHGELEALTKAIQQTIIRSEGERPEAPLKTEQVLPPKTEPTQPAELRDPPTQDDRLFDQPAQNSPQQQTSLVGMGLVASLMVGALLAMLWFMNFKLPSPVSTTYSDQPNNNQPATDSKPLASANQSVRVNKSPATIDPSPTLGPPPRTNASSGTHTHAEAIRESSNTGVANPAAKAPRRIEPQLVTKLSTNNGRGDRVNLPTANIDALKGDLYGKFVSKYGSLNSLTLASGNFELIHKEYKTKGHDSLIGQATKGVLTINSSPRAFSHFFCSTLKTAESEAYVSDIGVLSYPDGQWIIDDLKKDGTSLRVTGVEFKTNGNLIAWYRSGPDFEEFIVWERKNELSNLAGSELIRLHIQTQIEAIGRFNKSLPPSMKEEFRIMNTARNLRA